MIDSYQSEDQIEERKNICLIAGASVSGKTKFAKKIAVNNYNIISSIEEIHQIFDKKTIIIDSITSIFYSLLKQKRENDILSLFSFLETTNKEIIIITNIVGLGFVPIKKEDREFRDKLGFLNQKLSRYSSCIYLVIAGINYKLK